MDELIIALKKYYGRDAEFRKGQVEAIQGILQGKRTLVVQKTGWGKSLVYFLATKILREKTNSITLIISPLLVLMNNQIDSAMRLELNVKTINSENADQWDEIISDVYNDTVDALIISPERLANDDFKNILSNGLANRIGLFVVDEAHCISDWGHDFRPDYRRIIDIVNMLPPNVPVLATTATANDRVVEDIKMQLGDNLVISRGSLMRESLSIQVIRLDSKEERLAWLAECVPSIEGVGLIYCLTVKDCILVDKWLKHNGILSEPFYAGIDKEQKDVIVQKFLDNEIKVLVATVAFGMGFDKPDIGFVIHFQKPGNIVAYYQQIGRAGRALKNAYAVLLCGEEDDAINQYFIDSAFPTEELMNDVIETVQENPGIKKGEFEKYINMRRGKIENCIKYLEVNGDIYREKKQYYKALRPWNPDLEKSRAITETRRKELRQMNDFTRLSDCYMEYVAHVLDDPCARKCGKCAKCMGYDLIPIHVSQEKVAAAQRFVRADFNIIEPRKKWPAGIEKDGSNKIAEEYRCETGYVLSNYGDAGWGRQVADGKYKHNYFDDQLVQASYELLKNYVVENDIQWVTNVSSKRRPELVRNFAKRLAVQLGLRYSDTIQKTPTVCQKELNTSYLQCNNAYDSFEIGSVSAENVLLVDDIVDSRWTFTVCGYKLRKKGCGKVYPFALANSAGSLSEMG